MLVPIAFKMVFLISAIMLSAMALITYQSTEKFTEISSTREKDNNAVQARARATEVEGLFVSYVDKIKVIASLLLKEHVNKGENKKALDLTFNQDKDLVVVEVIKLDQPETDTPIRLVNEDFLKQYKLDKTYIDSLRSFQKKFNRFQFDSVFSGELEIRNSLTKNGAPLISIGVPFVTDDMGRITHVAIGEVRLDRLQKIFGVVSERTMYLVDKDGQLLAHPDEKKVFQAQSMSAIEIVQKAMDSPLKVGDTRFFNEELKEDFIGAFARTSIGIIVIAQISEELILEASRSVKRESIRIAGQVLSAALFLIFIFSISLTSPIEKLAEMAAKVAKGDFKVKSNVSSKDEVGALADAFDEMVVGLEERDKVKNVLNKFHGSAITDDLLKGELELGGSNKEVTVFFSDIRDFTKFSEGHTPEEVVMMLNEYFAIMVSIINKNKGVVDKFIGDAIMAVWGAPEKSDDDPFNAVKASLEMRQELDKLNERRQLRGEVPIKIGVGIHTGRAISGTIGSDERMEYTVIGDAVNTASRIEASTKSFGTDLLISGETSDIIAESYLIEEAGKVEVKGKTEPLRLYKVKGYIDADGNEIRVQTEWSDYEAGENAKVKMVS
ncbi:MAG: HAMP domain-containing protein [Bdellovibrionaceae bacterium]|nr:HAMP domain-containing protein [Pseudobdellovibrionaceae bacterium]